MKQRYASDFKAALRTAIASLAPESRTELRLLRFLCRNAGRAITRAELLTFVWDLNPAKVRTRTIDMHIAHLRRKLRDRAQPKLLRTLRREGYVLSI